MKNSEQYQVQQISISPAVGFTVAETKEGYKVEKSSKLLINESPLQLLPTLACLIGDRHATLLQQLFYLEHVFRGRYDENGIKWVRVALDDADDGVSWCEMMPYLGRNTISNIVDDLTTEGLMVSRKFKGRALWYRVNKVAVDSLAAPVARIKKGKERTVNTVKNKYQNLVDSNIVKNEYQNLDEQVPEFGITSTKIWYNEYQNLDASKTLFLDSTETNQDSTTTSNAPKSGAILESEEGLQFLAELEKLKKENELLSQEIQAKDDSANYPALGAVVVPPPSAAQNPPPAKVAKPKLPPVDKDKMTAMAVALKLNLDHAPSKKDITKSIRDLEHLYTADVTPENIAKVCAHLTNARFTPPPSYVAKQWQAAMIALEAAPMSLTAEIDPEVIRVMASIKMICIEPLEGWVGKIADDLKVVAQRVVEKGWQSHVAGFTWWGEGRPNLRVFALGLPEYVEKSLSGKLGHSSKTERIVPEHHEVDKQAVNLGKERWAAIKAAQLANKANQGATL